MSKRIEVGSLVVCRFFNTPERKFYGVEFLATVLEIVPQYNFHGLSGVEKGFRVRRGSGAEVVVKRKEIKRLASG